jgi:hypothetical protein
MLIPNHPDDERLAALVSRETDALADATLTAHVAACGQCTELIDELGALRAALADLPDLAPSRPLRLLPPVEARPAAAADRLGGWARRFFAPVLASGAALALVGVIGTAAPSLSDMGASPGSSGADEGARVQEFAAQDAAASEAAAAAPAPESQQSGPDTQSGTDIQSGDSEAGVTSASPLTATGDEETAARDRDAEAAPERQLAERSPWPMVLFAGVALIIGALLMRWILVPRAS